MLTPKYHSRLFGSTKEVSLHRSVFDAHVAAQNEQRKGTFGRFRTELAKHQKRRAENLCVSQVGDKVQLSIDVPGVKASDLTVRIENRVLSISGIRYVQSDHGGVRRIEHHRRFHIDIAIDAEHIEANWSHGVLSLIAPLRPKSSRQFKIPVTTITTHADASKGMDAVQPTGAGTKFEGMVDVMGN